jgi:protein-S-isoprenylcysteine O-methyltransferase Ste14
MIVLIRALTYGSILVGLALLFVPAPGIARPATGVLQVIGMVVGGAGAALALWCVFVFAFIGKGTPVPFDPPRRLVVRGPYRFVRNPMAIGVGLVLAGATFFYQSWLLLGYTALFALIIYLLVVLYEEPTLRRTFGAEYEVYIERVGRWWPSRSTGASPRI